MKGKKGDLNEENDEYLFATTIIYMKTQRKVTQKGY